MKINLPNKLTLLRIAMIPIFVLLMFFEKSFWCQVAAALVFISASVTDYLDGFIARKNNIVTNFGKFADPIADKMLVMSAFIMLVAQGRMPAWVCIIFLGREFAVSGFRLVAAGGGKVISAGILGKIKTVTQMIAAVALILFVPTTNQIDAMLGWFGDLGQVIANVMMYVMTFMTVWSGADYIYKNRHFIKDM